MNGLLALILFAGLARGAEPVAILVPGTFNSAVWGGHDVQTGRAPDFSDAVLEAVRSAGYTPHVVRGLKPIDTYEANGARAAEDVRRWYLEHYPDRRAPIVLVGHSAGGLMAFEAATKLADLPLRAIVAV